MDIVQSSNRIVNSFPPLNNITPFTRVDGWSFLEVLEGLRNYVVNTLVKEVDERHELITEQMNKWFDQYIKDFDMLKNDWQTLFDKFIEDVTNQIAALSDPAIASLINNSLSQTRQILDSRYLTRERINNNAGDVSAYLNNVEVFFHTTSRITGGYYPQCFTVNESLNEIYIAFLATQGTDRKILIRIYDKTTQLVKRERTFTTPFTSAGTEGLPYFYNVSDELCFIVRGGSSGFEYQIANFDTGEIGSPVTVQGAHKHCVDGDYFYTCSSGSGANGVETVYQYDWDSIKLGTPVLNQKIKLDAVPYPTKVQSFDVHNGSIIFSHGAFQEPSYISIYTLGGVLTKMVGYSQTEMFNLAKTIDPTLTNPSNHEAEGVDTWNGQLLTGHNFWNTDNPGPGQFIILRRNILEGVELTPNSVAPNPVWYGVSFIAPAKQDGGTFPPAVTRDGVTGFLEGIVGGLTSPNQQVGTINSNYAPRQTHRWSCPVIGSGGHVGNFLLTTGGLITFAGTNHPDFASAPETIRFQIDTSYRVEAK